MPYTRPGFSKCTGEVEHLYFMRMRFAPRSIGHFLLPALRLILPLLVLIALPGPAAAGSLVADQVTGGDLLASPRFLKAAPAGGETVAQDAGTSRATALVRAAAQRIRDLPGSDDPLESVNRYAHEFNAFLRRHLLEPVSVMYLDMTSQQVQTGVANVFANLREPMTLTSNLLLGETDAANDAATRFVVNTTAGLGGFYDRAAENGIPRRPMSLEEVLCRAGVPAGPYVVLPILGPGTVRDAAGRLGTLFVQYVVLGPIYVPYRVVDIAVQYVSLREQLRFIESHSLDTYIAHRSAYRQLSARLGCEGQAMQSELFGQ